MSGQTWRPWTPEDERRLRACYGRVPLEEIADRLGRTLPAVRLRAQRLGLRVKVGMEPGHAVYPLNAVKRMFGVSDYQVKRWIAAGKLPCHRSTVQVRGHGITQVYRADLYAFVASQRHLYLPWAIADASLHRYALALPPERDPWLTPKEVAARLGAPAGLVRRWLRRGDLAGDLVCGRWWVRSSKLGTFIPPPTTTMGQRKADWEARRRRAAAVERAGRPYGYRHVTGPAPTDSPHGRRPRWKRPRARRQAKEAA